MALLLFDGFGTYGGSAANFLNKWTSQSGIGFGTGRRGAGSSSLVIGNSNNGANDMAHCTVSAISTVIVGTALLRVGGANTGIVLRLGASEQLSLRWDSNLYLYVSRNGTTLWSGAGNPVYRLSGSNWRYVEFKATIHTTTGSWSLRMDGSDSTLVSQTGVNTAAQGGTTLDGVRFQGGNNDSNQQTEYGDLYICDDSGSAPHNNMLGDCRVDTLLPTADGTYSDFTKSAGATTWELLDEASPDSDTTYISSSTVGHKSTVNIADMPYTPSVVYGVNITDFSRKDDTGARDIAHVLRTNANDYFSSARALATAYNTGHSMWAVNPNTSAVFSKAEIDALEVGIKVDA